MSVFTRIWSAFSRVADAGNALADALQSLADSFREANANVRANLQLDGPTAQPLPAPEPEKKGVKRSHAN